MGLDIYAGTLTRYYSRNRKTSVQQWSEKHGMQVKIIRPVELSGDTVSLAKFAFSIIGQTVRHSEKYGTLIIYDY